MQHHTVMHHLSLSPWTWGQASRQFPCQVPPSPTSSARTTSCVRFHGSCASAPSLSKSSLWVLQVAGHLCSWMSCMSASCARWQRMRARVTASGGGWTLHIWTWCVHGLGPMQVGVDISGCVWGPAGMAEAAWQGVSGDVAAGLMHMRAHEHTQYDHGCTPVLPQLACIHALFSMKTCICHHHMCMSP